jgi:hypothetical protein
MRWANAQLNTISKKRTQDDFMLCQIGHENNTLCHLFKKSKIEAFFIGQQTLFYISQ